MEPIRRPDNVIVPKALEKRIEARRALQGTVDDMRGTLQRFGVKVPSGANKAQLETMLYDVMRSGTVLTAAETKAPIASSATKGGE